jgi:hypothetical protein
MHAVQSFRCLLAVITVSASLSGCSEPAHSAPRAEQKAPAAPAVAKAPAAAPAPLFAQDLVVNLAGEDVGTMTSRDVRTDDGGVRLLRTADLTIRRGATVTRLTTTTTVVLDKALRPVSYHFEKTDPGGTLVVDGVVAADRKTLQLHSAQNGAGVDNVVPLPADFAFSVGIEHEVRSAPRDGLKIERPAVLEELGAVVPLTTTVKKNADGTFTVTASFAGMTTEEVIDAAGRTLVSRTPSVGMVAYPWGHAPADVTALVGKKADLLAVSTWKVQNVKADARRVVYRITTPDAATFTLPEDARQKVLRRTDTTIDIEVGNGPSTTTTLSPADRARALSATPYEAVNDPRIKAAAATATAGAVSDDDKVAKLSHWVFQHVQKKGLDRGYAPAIATLESKSGDCTEHSVLLSALLRSVGIPTRIVDGVVVDHTNAGYHEWVEVDLGKGFVAVDPTFDAWPAGPQRVKLAQGSTLPDEHLPLSLAAARLLKHGVKFEVVGVE